ncbi:phosphonate ABC transporter, permease protein PhnE [Ectothiorhodospira mobilis]|uniref:phosphonate ABC transporter, permease protein PhnE n=1 Tax=Ectothiorhodospira mobilis TaxID=195064 RepID=UPI001EE94C8D|nr:phosphonate ABC transporter, permease protein PhnE [Ectothiorhodospira mobilis]MCG5536803.1 phosphonate ABC transporter, permease protein PhnE [Ectothiorhodospira mobilis]
MKRLRWPTPDGLPPRLIWAPLAAAALLLVFSAKLVEFDPLLVLSKLGDLAAFLGKMLASPPPLDYLPQLARKMLETVEMAIVATFVAAIISLPLGFLAARNATPHPWLGQIVRDALSFFRALPELVWALVFVSAVGLGPFPGILAIAVVSIGFMARFFAEAIEVVDERPIEGVQAHGASQFQVRTFAMLPQALPDFVGTLLYVLDHNLRAATVLGIVGAGGIGFDLITSIRYFEFDRLLIILLAIYLAVTVVDRLSDHLRTRVIHGGGYQHGR